MQRGPIFLEWTAEARREGQLQGKAELLLEVVKKRFGAVPKDLADHFYACKEDEPFCRWALLTITASSLEQFRQEVGR